MRHASALLVFLFTACAADEHVPFRSFLDDWQGLLSGNVAEADRGTEIALRSITITLTFRDSPDQTLELSLPPPDTWTDPRFQDPLRRLNFPQQALPGL